MLNEPTLNRLYAMKLNGMADAYEEQRGQAKMGELSFEERFAMLVQRQWLWKENRALSARLAYAELKESACIEDLDFRDARGLKRSVIEHPDRLIGCVRWHTWAVNALRQMPWVVRC